MRIYNILKSLATQLKSVNEKIKVYTFRTSLTANTAKVIHVPLPSGINTSYLPTVYCRFNDNYVFTPVQIDEVYIESATSLLVVAKAGATANYYFTVIFSKNDGNIGTI